MILLILSFLSVNPILDFADSLYLSRHYFDAATEYERFLFEFPLDSNSYYTRFQLGLSYLYGNEKERAENTLNDIVKHSNPYSKKAQKALIDHFIENNEFSRAKLEINDLLLFTNDSTEVFQLNKRLGWIAFNDYNFQQAGNHFLVAQDTLMFKATENLKRLKLKNPVTAMVLSTILPGTGEIYSGHFWTGIFAFLINAASIAGIIQSINRKNYVDASLIFSIFFSRFYFGSRQNAYDFANDYNQKLYEDRIKFLNQYHILSQKP